VKKYLPSVKIRYPPSEKKLIELLKRTWRSLYDTVPTIKKIILFGSYSRKDPHFGSDVDLLFIVSKRLENDFENIYEILTNLSLKYEWSPLLITEKRIKELQKEGIPFIRQIMKDGIEIFSI